MLPAKFFIGLGNPGAKYQNSRHNIGQNIIRSLPPNPGFLTTDTFMNESGIYVQKIVNFYKINLKSLYIIHDDLDIGVGEWRLQFDRGPAGHHGIESIVQHLNSQAFWRIRVGIGHPDDFTPVESYVLQPFTPTEKELISQTIYNIITEVKKLSGL